MSPSEQSFDMTISPVSRILPTHRQETCVMVIPSRMQPSRRRDPAFDKDQSRKSHGVRSRTRAHDCSDRHQAARWCSRTHEPETARKPETRRVTVMGAGGLERRRRRCRNPPTAWVSADLASVFLRKLRGHLAAVIEAEQNTLSPGAATHRQDLRIRSGGALGMAP